MKTRFSTIALTNFQPDFANSLSFYANGENKEEVTFSNIGGAREKQLERLRSDPTFRQCGENERGHELFEEDGSRAQAALGELES